MMKNTHRFNKISPHDLHQWLNEGKNFALIDTLTSDHYQKVRLPNAKNACVFEVTFLDQVAKIADKNDHDIVVYGSSSKSMDAVTAAEKLVRAGYRKVNAFEGGLQLWKASGYDLEGEDPEVLVKHEWILSLEDRTYIVDTGQSMIEWTGRNPNTRHYGRIKLSKGEIFVNDGEIRGIFEIDMTSIENINLEKDPLQPVLITHLMSDVFFC